MRPTSNRATPTKNGPPHRPVLTTFTFADEADEQPCHSGEAWYPASCRMADSARKRATYADVLAAPAHLLAEVIAGDLHLQPRPAARHAVATSGLGYELIGPYQRGKGGPGGWIILDEPELHLGPDPDILVPDLAGWRRARLPEVPDVAYFDIAPDWVCEALSQSTAALDRTSKLPVYQREKVAHVWLLDPTAKTLEIYRLDGQTYRLVGVHAGNVKVRAEPFDATELDLSALWLPAPPPPADDGHQDGR